jgi:glycosyltransferase involved in cell wall biosynthesis
VKVAIVSDSPTLTTGFGITTGRIAGGLAAAGHTVTCFGLKGHPAAPVTGAFTVRPVRVEEDWAPLLAAFLEEEGPDALLLNVDLFNLREVLDYCTRSRWRGPLIGYVILDGVPAYDEYACLVQRFDVHLATTRAGVAFLERCGAQDVILAPPGVDMSVFAALPAREALRRRAGLEGHFVVGVFGRNSERKQQPRVLRALAALAPGAELDGVAAYFHCAVRGYWHLDELAAGLGMSNHVLHPGGRAFDEAVGVPVRGVSDLLGEEGGGEAPDEPRIPPEYGYVERLNCCDLVVNVAHCGDFEQVLIEAQACGVPLAATDDGGIMAEAMGGGAIPLRVADVGPGRIGQLCHFVSPGAIADAIRTVRGSPALAAELRERGFENARKYPWDRLTAAVLEAVEMRLRPGVDHA